MKRCCIVVGGPSHAQRRPVGQKEDSKEGKNMRLYSEYDNAGSDLRQEDSENLCGFDLPAIFQIRNDY